MMRRPPRSTQSRSSAASDVYKRQAEKEAWLARGLGGKGKIDVQRFKGLGEMDAKDLKDTTMNPETRKLIRVSICLLYTSPSPRDRTRSRMPSSA